MDAEAERVWDEAWSGKDYGRRKSTLRSWLTVERFASERSRVWTWGVVKAFPPEAALETVSVLRRLGPRAAIITLGSESGKQKPWCCFSSTNTC
jgi:hypothetical protein